MQIACPMCGGAGALGRMKQSTIASVDGKPTKPEVEYVRCPECKGIGTAEAGFLAKRMGMIGGDGK